MKSIAIVFVLFISLYGAFPDWYYKIKNSKKKKEAFVEIILPLINKENQKILQTRKKIISMFKTKDLNETYLKQVAKTYKIKDIHNLHEYLMKINYIPPSLALAQAAVESGWGNSRFVKVANNIFGHWEYSDKGVAPKDKHKNIKITYTLKKFNSLEESIATYMRNLNRNRAYRQFRKLRAKYLEENKTFNGVLAASTMKNYSQLREKYVKLLQKMIKSYKWYKYDYKIKE